MKYAHLEENTNKIFGWYSDDIHTNIPAPNIEVTEKVWQEAININANCYENGKFIVKDFRTDEEIQEQELQIKINEAKEYLASTDHKFYNGYKQKEGEDLVEIERLRDEAREFIRANEIWVDDDSSYEPQDGSGFIRLF